MQTIDRRLECLEREANYCGYIREHRLNPLAQTEKTTSNEAFTLIFSEIHGEIKSLEKQQAA